MKAQLVEQYGEESDGEEEVEELRNKPVIVGLRNDSDDEDEIKVDKKAAKKVEAAAAVKAR